MSVYVMFGVFNVSNFKASLSVIRGTILPSVSYTVNPFFFA